MANKVFEQKESYMHKLAKELLFSWLKDAEEESNKSCKFAQFSWRQNYGVFMELPFCKQDDPYYFENQKFIDGVDDNGDLIIDYSSDRGEILFVPDICVFHKGTPVYFFEVVHTSPVSESKMDKIKAFFDGYYLEIVEIEATEILRHTKKPSNLKCKITRL